VLEEMKPYCVSTDKIRPAAPAETLAHLYLSRQNESFIPGPEGEQQNFVDRRADSDADSEISDQEQRPTHGEDPVKSEDEMTDDAMEDAPQGRLEEPHEESDHGRQPDGELSPELHSDVEFQSDAELEELRGDVEHAPRKQPRLREQLDDYPAGALRVHQRRRSSE
jgi:hypothetical protein